MLSKYIPLHFIENYNEILKKNYILSAGYVMYVEFSGFSAMSDKLSSGGGTASKILSSSLNTIFVQLMKIIHKRGGSVYKFSGDSMTVFFPKTVHSRSVNNCGIELIKEMKDKRNIRTPYGLFKVESKIGASYGDVIIGQLGKNEKDYFIAGSALEAAIECAETADNGEFVVNCSLRFKLGLCNFKVKKECFYKAEAVEELFESLPHENSVRKIHNIESFTRKVIIDIDYENDYGHGEFNYCTILSIGFSEIYYGNKFEYSELNEFMTEVFRIASNYGGFVNKADLRNNNSRLLLLFGMHSAAENNEEMSARCALDIMKVSTGNIKPRMAIYSGTGYFGTAGSRDRHEFIALGKAVNTSIRLMKTSKQNVIIISDTSASKIAGAELVNPKDQGFKGIRERYKVFEIREFKQNKNKSCKKVSGSFKELSDYEKILHEGLIKRIFITGVSGTGKSIIAKEFSKISSGNGKVFSILCLKETDNVPYNAVKKLLYMFLESISTNKKYALKKMLSDIKEEHNQDFYSEFLGFTPSAVIPDRSMSNIVDDVTVFIFLNFLQKYRSSVFIDNMQFIDAESLNVLMVLFRMEPGTDCVFNLITDNEEKIKCLKTGINEHTFFIKNPVIPEKDGNLTNIIQDRIKNLDSDARRILSTASASGSVFTLNSLTMIEKLYSKLSEEEIKTKLKFLEGQCFIESEDNKAGEYIFMDPAIREIVYYGLSEQEKIKYHAEFAEVYEAAITNEENELSYLAEYHYRLAGNNEKSKKYLMRAVFSSFRYFCYGSAMVFVSKLKNMKLSGAESAELMLLEADIFRMTGENEKGIALCDDVKKLFSSGNIFYNKALSLKAETLLESGRYADTVSEAELSDKAADINFYVKVNCLKGIALLKMGLESAAEAVSTEFYSMKNDLTDPVAKAKIFRLSGELNLFKSKFKIARAYFEDMYDISAEYCLTGEKLEAIEKISLSFEREGDHKKAIDMLEKLCDESLRSHNFDHALSSIESYILNSASQKLNKRAVFYADRWLNAANKYRNQRSIRNIKELMKLKFSAH